MNTATQPSLLPPEGTGLLTGDWIERLARAYSLQRGWEPEQWDHATGPECGTIWETKSSIINDFRKAYAGIFPSPNDEEASQYMRQWAELIEDAVEMEGGRHLMRVLLDDTLLLRKLLALRYAGTNLYADDGELQDNSELPSIDFLRDAPHAIHRKMIERTERKLRALGVAPL